jgi:hypothetical protein
MNVDTDTQRTQLRVTHGASTNLRNSPEFWARVAELEKMLGIEEEAPACSRPTSA